MTSWEYKMVKILEDTVLLEDLNELGLQGWQLCDSGESKLSEHILIFRRPLDN